MMSVSRLAFKSTIFAAGLLAFSLSLALASETYPKSLSLEQQAKLSLAELERLFLLERCGNRCESQTFSDRKPDEPITLAQQLVIEAYTSSYAIINLRIFLAGLEKLPTTKEILYRGMNSRHISATRVGQTFSFDRITSASLNREVAEGFLGDTLVILKSKSARDISSYSTANESEFIIPPGTKFRVDKISTAKVTIWDGPASNPQEKQVDISVYEVSEI
jgi:hypothetical protein